MKKILALLLALVLVLSLAACGGGDDEKAPASNEPQSSQQQEQQGDQTSEADPVEDEPEEQSGETLAEMTAGTFEGPFDSKWPDSKWTRLLPRPEFLELDESGTMPEDSDDSAGFSVSCGGATMEQVTAYAKEVQAAGFSENVNEQGNAQIYLLTAWNAYGVKCEININTMIGLTTIEITKP